MPFWDSDNIFTRWSVLVVRAGVARFRKVGGF